MRFRVFPCDLEGVGCYRVIYPYGMLDLHTSHDVEMGYAPPLVDERGRTRLEIPEAAVGGAHGPAADEFLDADVYVLQRPLEKVYAPLAAWLRSHGKTVVVDLDDFMHGIPDGNKGKRSIAESPRHSFEALTHVLRYTDLLTVTTPRLAELYGDQVPRVVVLSNRLLRKDWAEIQPVHELERGRVRVGWMGWLIYRGGDLKVLKPVIRKWLRKHPEAVFVNVGHPDVLTYLDVPRDQRLHVQGARFPLHAAPTSQIDIGLAPLRMTAFNECKSALKGMEYGACGIPVVASPTGPYREWVEPGVNGMLAKDPGEWIDALDHMLEGDRWRQMGAANRAKTQLHMIDEAWPAWLEAYTPAHDDRPQTPEGDAAAGHVRGGLDGRDLRAGVRSAGAARQAREPLAGRA